MNSVLRKLYYKINPRLRVKATILGCRPIAHQKALFTGAGKFIIGSNVVIGWKQSPQYESSYGYFESRLSSSSIRIGENCIFSNGASIISEGEEGGGITIGNRCVFGANFRCYDSDFHGLLPTQRNDRRYIKTRPVKIGDDCFFGESCIVLKGVVLGGGCVVGAGSVVTASFEEGSIIAGNPARLIRRIDVS